MSDATIILPSPQAAAPLPAAPDADAAALGRLLGALASRPGPVPKHLYPSAGTLYPVQAYVSLQDQTGPLPPGSYYHDPDAHALVAVSSGPVRRPQADILLILVARDSAIRPVYGDATDAFVLLEAGYMHAALLRTAAQAGLRLIDTGDLAGADMAPLRLDADHRPLICWSVQR